MINLIVALPAEAKPLNQYFGLKRVQPDGDYPIYRNEDIQLVLSGTGRQQAADAYQSLSSTDADYWLNIGIAGHPTAAIGELFQVNQVYDRSTEKSWKLPCQHAPSLPRSRLTTVNEAITDYPENALYDMEAAGIIDRLAEHDQLARTTVLKVVSDNVENPTKQINGQLVKLLINNHLNTIDKLLHAIRQ
jgi:nucleoside phosphorylase